MKTPPIFAVVWLLAGLVAHAGEHHEVALNGIAAFGGHQYAALVVDQQMTSAGQGFVLAEGDSLNGVRLISMDVRRQSVLIEDGGQQETLHLHGSPDVAGNIAAIEADMAAANAPEDYSYGKRKVYVNTALIPGNPGWGTLPPNPSPMLRNSGSSAGGSSTAPGTTSGNSPSAGTSANPGTQSADNNPAFSSGGTSSLPSDSSSFNQSVPGSIASKGAGTTTQTLPDWYLDSESIESDRIATQQQVLDGEMAPLPRTPLTPAGTPDALVDNPNGVYANHNADFLTQNWSQM